MSATRSIWTDCRRLLIVFPYTEESNYKEYRKALDIMLNESNVVDLKLVVVLPDSVKKETMPQHKLIHYLSNKDFNLFGRLKDDTFDTVMVQPYDMLLWFQVENKKLAKLLSGAHATWKVGICSDYAFFNLKGDCRSEYPLEIVNFAKRLLEKIS
ncbi:MAG: DUF6913 domain-containing protein [Flavobacteriia bacterium]